MKNLILGFYLNDVMGRDVFKSLPVEQQQTSRKIIENMARLDETFYLPQNAYPLELVNVEVLKEFMDNSPSDWFRKFLRVYCYHLDITHRDQNTGSLGYIPGIYEYMELRCHYAGVHHIVLWIEYSEGKFLDWDSLKAAGIAQQLERLHWVTAAFEALSNDLFSFEKEVIDCEADSNLVMILALNKPGLTLSEAIFQACDIVRSLLMEVLALMDTIRKEMEAMASTDPALWLTVKVHLDGIARCVKAGWLWHCHSRRYKRTLSLWVETRLVNASVKDPA
jgi:hypothetical protein